MDRVIWYCGSIAPQQPLATAPITTYRRSISRVSPIGYKLNPWFLEHVPIRSSHSVMPALVTGIHVFLAAPPYAPPFGGSVGRGADVDGRASPAMTPDKWFNMTGTNSKSFLRRTGHARCRRHRGHAPVHGLRGRGQRDRPDEAAAGHGN